MGLGLTIFPEFSWVLFIYVFIHLFEFLRVRDFSWHQHAHPQHGTVTRWDLVALSPSEADDGTSFSPFSAAYLRSEILRHGQGRPLCPGENPEFIDMELTCRAISPRVVEKSTPAVPRQGKT